MLISCLKVTFNKRGDKGKHVFKIHANPLENLNSYTYLGIKISRKNRSLQSTLRALSVKEKQALFSLKTNLNMVKMPIKVLLKIYDTMLVPILFYGAELWTASYKLTSNKWEKI